MEKIFDSLDLIIFDKNGFYIEEEKSLHYLGINSPISIENTDKKVLWLNTSGWNQTYRLGYPFWSKFREFYISSIGYPIDFKSNHRYLSKIISENTQVIEAKDINISTQYVKLTLSSYFSIMYLDKYNQNHDLVLSTICLGHHVLSIHEFKTWFFDEFIQIFTVENILLLKLLDLKLNATFPIESWAIYVHHSLKILELISVVNHWKDHTDELSHLIALLNVDSSSGWILKYKEGSLEDE